MRRLVVVAGLLVIGNGSAFGQASVAKELTAIEHRIMNATVKKDRATMELIYADDYYCVHSNGVATNKEQEIEKTMSGDNAWTSYQLSNIRVRTYDKVALLTAELTLTGSAKGYKPGTRRFLDVFVRRNGRWQQVGCQSTLIQ
jgi:hypothetical protein